MSKADAAVELDWADGTYRFRLALAQLEELQEKVNGWRVKLGAQPIGPRTLLAQLDAIDVWQGDVNEVIRLGLIGGATPGDGMTPTKALQIVKRYGAGVRPLAESSMVARAVLAAAIVGVPDDPVGKPEAEQAETEATTASSSPPSTERAPQ